MKVKDKINLIRKVASLNVDILGYFKVSDVIFQIIDTLDNLELIDFEDAIDLEKLANSVKSNDDAYSLKLSVIDYILNLK